MLTKEFYFSKAFINPSLTLYLGGKSPYVRTVSNTGALGQVGNSVSFAAFLSKPFPPSHGPASS